MPYPPRYLPRTDFALSEQSGQPVSGRALATELANLAESVLQVQAFIKAAFTSDKRLQPAVLLSQELVQTETFYPAVDTDTFTIPNGAEATAGSFVRVFVDGVLIDPNDVYVDLGAQTFTLPTPAPGGSVVVAELINDYATLRSELASNLNGVGAALVGIEDAIGKFSSTTVEDALAELATKHDELLAALGDLSKYAKIDGSRPWENHQSMGGHRLTNLADGTDPSDAATVQQLAALAAIYGDLAQVFLPLVGGVMSGPIDMGDNRIINVADPVEPKDAANKQGLDTVAGVAASAVTTADAAAALAQSMETRILATEIAVMQAGIQPYKAYTAPGAYSFVPANEAYPGVKKLIIVIAGGGGGGGGGGSYNGDNWYGYPGYPGTVKVVEYELDPDTPCGDPLIITVGPGGDGGGYGNPHGHRGGDGTRSTVMVGSDIIAEAAGGGAGNGDSGVLWNPATSAVQRWPMSAVGYRFIPHFLDRTQGHAAEECRGIDAKMADGGSGGGRGMHGSGGRGGRGGDGFVIIYWDVETP